MKHLKYKLENDLDLLSIRMMSLRKKEIPVIIKHLFFRCFFLLCFVPVCSQNLSELRTDSLFIRKGSVVKINRKKIKTYSDTFIIVQPNTVYFVTRNKDDLFYYYLKNKAQKNFWTRELHNIIISPPETFKKTDSLKTAPGNQSFVQYQNKTIRHIFIRQLPVFGPTIDDTLHGPSTFFEKTANNLHIQTKKFLIQKNLLFKENDLINPDNLADNERILRNLPYIEDAKIELISPNNNTDSVDVFILIKDNWSLAFDLRLENLTAGRLDLMNKNILGLGQEMQYSALWNNRKKPATGYEGIYKIPNIKGTFITGNIVYNKIFDSQLIGINLSRSFFTPNIKYAGGFSFSNIKSEILDKSFTTPVYSQIEYNHYEGWIGRSFLLTRKNIIGPRQNLTFSGKIIYNKYYDRPIVTENSDYIYWNKTLSLFSISFSHQNFFESNLIYNFGRTEDIPVGIKFNITGGFEKNEFSKRTYFESELSAGKFLGPFGYLYSGALFSTFINKQKAEQGLINTNLNYFTNLFVIKRYSFRQFMNINLTQGINRFLKDSISMNDKLGLTGFRNDSIYGNRRLNLKFELVCFTPWKVAGFKFVLFMFGDYTWLAKQNEQLLYGKPYNGFGFGVRIRNDRLVFNTIQFRFAFYPNIPENSVARLFYISGEPILRTPDFSPKEPGLPVFQ